MTVRTANSKRKTATGNAPPQDDDKEAYGFLLIIRWLTFLAIELREKNPATLAVAVVIAEYMEGARKGEHSYSSYTCSVSRYSIADRLGISQQAVQGHVNILLERGLLGVEAFRTGAAHFFSIPPKMQERFREERHRYDEAVEARLERKAIRKAARAKADEDRKAGLGLRGPETKSRKPKPAKSSRKPFEAWRERQKGGAAAPSKVTTCTLSRSQAAPCHRDNLQPVTVTTCSLSEETFLDTSLESVQEKAAGAAAAPDGAPRAAAKEGQYKAGDRVWHSSGTKVVVTGIAEDGAVLVRFANGSGTVHRVSADSLSCFR